MAIYAEIYALRYGAPWLGQRAEVAVVRLANTILLDEAPTVPDHALRVEWAQWAATRSSLAATAPFMWPLALDPVIQDKGEESSDQEIDAVIEAVLPRILVDFNANPPIGSGSARAGMPNMMPPMPMPAMPPMPRSRPVRR